MFLAAEETFFEIFLKNNRCFLNFRFRLDNGIWVVTFGLNMLIEGISRGKTFPALITSKLIVLLFFQLLHFAAKLF